MITKEIEYILSFLSVIEKTMFYNIYVLCGPKVTLGNGSESEIICQLKKPFVEQKVTRKIRLYLFNELEGDVMKMTKKYFGKAFKFCTIYCRMTDFTIL